jgi:hypothetical protein
VSRALCTHAASDIKCDTPFAARHAAIITETPAAFLLGETRACDKQ